MLRSLHRKLVLILVLLILSLMAVVGAFLMSGVTGFYTREFHTQMSAIWQDPQFVSALTEAAMGESPVADMAARLDAHTGQLGVDEDRRNYYILDGQTGAKLYTSDPADQQPDITPNIVAALGGRSGSASSMTEPYFDVAFPIGGYIVYIRDNKETLRTQNDEMFMIILEALLFGLGISILLSFLLSKTMTTPIESLTRTARRVAAGDFSSPPQAHSADEIGVLTQTFNNMAYVLRETLEAVGSERDKLGTLFLHMADGVVAFGHDGMLIQMNPAAERMLGVQYRDSLRYADLFGEVTSWEEASALRPPNFLEADTMRLGRALRLFFAVFGRPAADSAAPAAGKPSEPYGVMCVIHDVTEQQRLEAVRREFVSNVSHELRTPLTNIKSYAETIVESPGGLPPETVLSFSQVIVNEADRMTRIVRDLLTLSKFDYGKMDWNMGLFNVGETLRGIYDAMLMEAKRHGHTMTLEFLAMPPDIWGDRERVEQVLANILSNALNYTPDGGQIDVSLDMERDHVGISVRDTGVGIPQEAIPRLFERFYRVDKHRSRSTGGTGLGLAIAKEIVEKHGGAITMHSEQGKGTTVRVTLPLRRPEP